MPHDSTLLFGTSTSLNPSPSFPGHPCRGMGIVQRHVVKGSQDSGPIHPVLPRRPRTPEDQDAGGGRGHGRDVVFRFILPMSHACALQKRRDALVICFLSFTYEDMGNY